MIAQPYFAIAFALLLVPLALTAVSVVRRDVSGAREQTRRDRRQRKHDDLWFLLVGAISIAGCSITAWLGYWWVAAAATMPAVAQLVILRRRRSKAQSTEAS